MGRIRTPENFEIAALKMKQQTASAHDPMRAGSGTPWEDRGSYGLAGAFFKTVGASLISPGKLADSIRRPETTSDAFGFLIGCAVCWGVSAVVHGFIWMHWLQNNPKIDFDRQTFLIETALAAVASGFGLWVLFRLYNLIYSKLVAQEKHLPVVSAALLYNTNVYALGPSVLAVIPFVGPPLAALWILVDLIAVGRARLRLKVAAALVDAFIPFLVCGAAAVGGYYVGLVLVHQVIGSPSTVIAPNPDAKPSAS